MQLKRGDMFKETFINAAFFATGNSQLTVDGSLVMGAGSAKALAECEPSLPNIFGHMLKNMSNKDDYKYLFTVLAYPHNYGHGVKYTPIMYGLLQTKVDWREDSKLEMVLDNINAFKMLTEYFSKMTFRLAFPGIANGGLSKYKGEILSKLQLLPGNVEVWERY